MVSSDKPFIYIFIHTKCSNNTKQNKISNSKDPLSVSGADSVNEHRIITEVVSMT